VAVYGDPPPLQSVQEDAPTNPVPGSYGWLKLQQDQMVMKAAAKGLPSLILCPPNISGPHSYFLLSLVDTLRANAFALLETGTSPCNLIDVVNLSHAIELALLNGPEDGTRMFVTDDAPTTWRDVIESLLPLVESTTDIPSVSREQLASVSTTNEKTSLSLTKSLKHLISSHVREAMRKDPLLEKVDVTVRRGIARMGKALESRLRLSLEGPSKIVKVTVAPKFNSGLCRQQLRGVQHSCALAKSHIGYKPIYTAAESMEAFCRWYRSHHGMDLGVWSLLRQLN
jgi:nucleoside-diphosphate-sugar epimerase